MRSTAVVVGMLLLPSCGGESVRPASEEPYLEAAVRAGTWVLSAARSDGGIPDRVGASAATPSLGQGSAGRSLFLAELFDVAGSPAFRDAALSEARWAISARSEVDGDYSLYNGLSGVAFAATEVGSVLDEPPLVEEGRRLFLEIAGAGPGGGGGGWGTVNDVLAGTAGIGLSLLYAHERLGETPFLEAAVQAGDLLLANGESFPDGRMRWLRSAASPLDLPNFSHGTAGIGFFLLRLGARSGLDRFTSAGLAALRYVASIADTSGGLFLVPYGVPNEGYATLYDIGWAHGPAGTARAQYVAWNARGDEAARSAFVASARTLLAAGVPGPSADTVRWRGPFPIDRRFGTSGAASFLLDAGRATGDPSLTEAALRIADALLARATRDDMGVHWSVPLYGFQAGEGSAVFTGYFYGSAGIGLSLLQAHAARAGRSPRVRLPDDPFP